MAIDNPKKHGVYMCQWTNPSNPYEFKAGWFYNYFSKSGKWHMGNRFLDEVSWSTSVIRPPMTLVSWRMLTEEEATYLATLKGTT